MSTIAAGTTSGTALVSTGDTTGTLTLQTNGTTTAVTIGTNQVVTLAQPLPAASGGTGSTATPTAGGVPYGTGSATAFTAAGTSGQVLTSAGSSAPTWAAPAIPGATAQYSIVGPDLSGGYATQAFNPSGLASGLIYTNNANGLYASGSGTMRTTGNPFWSSYYGCWVTTMLSTSSTIYGIAISQDGLGWRIVLANLSSAIGISTSLVNISGGGGAPVLAVDDSNGRFFYMYSNGTNVIVAYSSITSTVLQTGNWTSVTVAAGTTAGGLVYCKMATTGASGIVAYFNNGTNVPIYTCSAGGTTFTLRSTITNIATELGYLDYQENGYISLPLQGSGALKVGYNLSGDITTGWATGTFTAVPTNSRKGFVGNGYMVYTSGGALYWSTNGTTWTQQLVGSVTGNLRGFAYTGSVWIAWDTDASFISATSAITSTWSVYSGGGNIQRNIGIGNPYNVRVTAT
jgi:hypothetical protein